MNVLIVDTSVWVQYLAGTKLPEVDLALKEGRVWLAPIVASELLSARLSVSERQALQEMLVELPLCSCPFEHWVRVGELRALCAQKGFKISTPDAHIAQCTIDLNGYLGSLDKIFEKVAKISPLRLLDTKVTKLKTYIR